MDDKDRKRLRELIKKQEHMLLDEKEILELNELIDKFGPQIMADLRKSADELFND